MNSKSILFAVILTLAAHLAFIEAAPAEDIIAPPPENIIKLLKREHPRLLASAEDFARLKQQVAAVPQLKDWHKELHERAQRILSEPPSKYEIPDGLRLLSTSRRVLHRVYTLSLMYWLENNKQYVDRAWTELNAAASFPDWNPRHFLDTAEMTHAFAIGYDWLYDAWTEEQRAALREAMIKLGLTPGLESYSGSRSYGWWMKAHHNWNQVCNGGLGMGVLAIGDVEPALAGQILHAAVESIKLPMAQFAPDGAWNEGPGYWNYATSYNVVFLAALESALGTDFGLSQIKAFSDTGLFPMYLTGPLGRTFNYADGGDGTIRAAQMFWLARKFNKPVYAWYERQVASPSALDAVWFDPRGDSPKTADLAPDKYFRGVEVVTMRSSWDDPNALFVGFKAGDNKANHSNLDLGTFVLDALGVRWALDLGADNYNLPGYFGSNRWNLYRMRAEGHNTLLVGPGIEPDQNPSAKASIIKFQSKPEKAFAIADLTPAYAKTAAKVVRGISMLDRKMVLLQDEVKTDKPTPVYWFLHTKSDVEINTDKTSAALRQGNDRLYAKILSPAGATFSIMKASPLPSSPNPDGQARNEGISKLAICLKDATDLSLAVLLVPLRKDEQPPGKFPEVSPLAKW